MAEFYDQPIFAVRLVAESAKGLLMWEITSPGGNPYGQMATTKTPTWVKVLKLIRFHANFPIIIEIRGTKETQLLRVERVFSSSEFDIGMRGPDGKLLGRMAREPIKGSVERGSYDYKVLDVDKILIGSLRGNWRGSMLQIYDDKGSIIGKISRHDPSLSRVVFQMGQRYHVVHNYFPPKNQTKRMLLMGAAAAIDSLLK